MSNAPSDVVSIVLSKLDGVKKAGGGWQARCPCRNDDENPSLSISEGEGGRALVHCHRGEGCSVVEICQSIGMKVTDLFPADVKKKEERKLSLVASYDYRDADGTLLFQKQRFIDQFNKKTFKQRRPDPSDPNKWIFSLDDVERVLYRLPQVLAAKRNHETIWLVEGEKDADTLASLGMCATTPPNGAGKWLDIHTEALADATVFIIADNDRVGHEHAVMVEQILTARGCTVVGYVPPEGFKDITDLIQAGKSVDDLLELSTVSPIVESEATDVEAVDDATAKFSELSEQIITLLARGNLTEETRLNRAQLLIGTFGNKERIDTGRLVNWSDLLDEEDSGEYDWVIPGLLERGERVILVAQEGIGKRAIITSVLPTPDGWTTLRDVRVGDHVIDRFGTPCLVTYIGPIENNPDAYRVTFSDGNHIDADAEHQWYTETLREREKRMLGGVRTTLEIKATLISNRSSKALNHAIPTTKPLCLTEAQLPIPPYTLGAWLGDGTTIGGSICSEDDEILENIRQDGYIVRKRESTLYMYGILGLQIQLRELGCFGYKHIPVVYARGSYEQRLALVQGLMDTDGYAYKNGTCEFSVNNEVLARGFLDLIQTMGIKATMRTGLSKLYGRITGTRYRISFKTDLPVFRLTRKLDRLPKSLRTPRSLYRYIVSVEPIPPSPMRCISVDSPDNTYLIGDAYIPTHNTMLARQIAICSAAGIHPFTKARIPPIRTLTIDLENPERIIKRTSASIMGASRRFGYVDKIEAHILIKPSGVDLMRSADRALIEEAVDKIRPDLLLLGPVYKSFIDPGGRTSEAVTVEVAKYFDMIRDYYKCALWLEHHAPLGSSPTTRDIRPFGSAVWSRWPEFGLALTPDPTSVGEYMYDVRHFRGARDPREFPLKMKRGKVFPFDVIEFMKV